MTCNLDIGFSIPPTCLNAVCTTTPGTYTSFGSCESIFFYQFLNIKSPKVVQKDVRPALTQPLANHVIQIIIWMEQFARNVLKVSMSILLQPVQVFLS